MQVDFSTVAIIITNLLFATLTLEGYLLAFYPKIK